MRESIKKFREEAQKLENSEALQVKFSRFITLNCLKKVLSVLFYVVSFSPLKAYLLWYILWEHLTVYTIGNVSTLQAARKKFHAVESEASKSSEILKDTLEGIKDKMEHVLEEAGKSEIAKKAGQLLLPVL